MQKGRAGKSQSSDIKSLTGMSITKGLKCFGKDEWHQEKYRVSAKRGWRKLHIAVDDKHVIHASSLTGRFESDDKTVNDLVDQIDNDAEQITADGAYDAMFMKHYLVNLQM